MGLVSYTPLYIRSRGRKRTHILFGKSRRSDPGVVVYLAHFTFGGLRWDLKWNDGGSQRRLNKLTYDFIFQSSVKVTKRIGLCEHRKSAI